MSEQIGVILIFAGLAAAGTGGLWLATWDLAVIFGRRTTRHLLVPLALLGTIRRIERSQRRNHAAGQVPVLTVSLDVTPQF